MHPQTAEVIEKKNEEELMDLVLKLNEQLKDTEQELQKPLQSRQSESNSQPQNVVRVVSIAVPSTLVTSLAPNFPLATVETIEVTGTSQVGTSSQITEELIKSIEEMKLQFFELQKVKEKFITLEQKYDVSKFNFAEEVRKNKSLSQQVKTLEKDLTFKKPLTNIRKILWTNITQSINYVWSSIQIIFEWINLVKDFLQEIENSKQELGVKPEEAIKLINFLNSRLGISWNS